MKTNVVKGLVSGAILVFVSSSLLAQNLDFNSISTTSERAIRLSWNSTSNEVYTVQYADALNDNFDGTTQWKNLYIHYPSHGTNTFIGDYGDYSVETLALLGWVRASRRIGLITC
jgi:hypothetical protein